MEAYLINAAKTQLAPVYVCVGKSQGHVDMSPDIATGAYVLTCIIYAYTCMHDV